MRVLVCAALLGLASVVALPQLNERAQLRAPPPSWFEGGTNVPGSKEPGDERNAEAALRGGWVGESTIWRARVLRRSRGIRRWQQKNGAPPPVTPALIAADVASALTSSFLLAPFVAAVDKAVVEAASGHATTAGSFFGTMYELVSDPIAFVQTPAFLMIWAVYGCTYIAANVVSTSCRRLNMNDAVPKFGVVLSVNIYASLLKDAAFAQSFGDAGGSMAIPVVTYALWFFRDMCTILTSFNAPAKVARFLSRHRVLEPVLAASVAQVLCPVTMQLFTTPIHLLGLNFANHNGVALVDRLADVQGLFAASCAIRMVRVLPAFGFGGIGNNYMRDMAHAKIAERWPGVSVEAGQR